MNGAWENNHAGAEASQTVRKGFGGIALALILMLMPLFYVLSPTLFMSLDRIGVQMPGWLESALVITWMPIEWYIETELPGAEELIRFNDWVAGS